ncbi:MAG TPA: hypothetical protein PKA62_16250, partial [Thermoanaerobaculia bacterium]|nr:hypothetical protein [Thermoanaerobaculia bacterium]
MDTSKPGTGSLSGGTLEKTELAEVLRNAYVSRKHLQVLVSFRGEERSFWFRRGRLVSASSNREAQHVGDLLRSFGLASESVLFAAFERALAEPGRGLASALREAGAVAPYVADACVRALAEMVLYSTFGVRVGATRERDARLFARGAARFVLTVRPEHEPRLVEV